MAVCYICSSNNHVDEHHIDCQHGKVSPDTVLLCRRCHRTYHDFGLKCFDDELLERAIEIENRRRAMYKRPPITREEVVRQRSDYFYKKHGIKRPNDLSKSQLELGVSKRPKVVRLGIEPICGWGWIEENAGKVHPEQEIKVWCNGKVVLELSSSSVRRGLIRSIMTMANKEGNRERNKN